MRVDVERVIHQPAEAIFAVVSDPPSRPLWQENTSAVEILTAGPVGLGTRWRESSRGIGLVQVEVVGFEENALWKEAGSADAGTGSVTVRLRDEGAGATRVSVSVEVRLRGARRLMERALEPAVRRQLPADLGRLDALLSARAEGD